MVIFREFRFEAAHYLPHVPADHKCHRLHGHSYRLVVHVKGELNPERGWVMDFADLRRGVDPIIEQLDHRLLNELPGLSNPTAEILVVWIWDRLRPSLPGLARLELFETPKAGCIYEGS